MSGSDTPPAAVAAKGMFFPEMPPALPGETDDQYTNRLTGYSGEDLIPYDHDRNRQCSIGWHEECSERDLSPFEARADLEKSGRHCKCPCHTLWGHFAARVPALEEALAAIWLSAPEEIRQRYSGIGVSLVGKILDAHPQFRDWYPVKPKGE